MRKIIPPKSTGPTLSPSAPPPPPASEDDNDIATMLTKSIEILRREIRHLMYESSQTKLNKGSATDLVNYIKLLSDLHEKEQELVSKLTDEELKEILEKRNGNKTEPSSSGEGTEE